MKRKDREMEYLTLVLGILAFCSIYRLLRQDSELHLLRKEKEHLSFWRQHWEDQTDEWRLKYLQAEDELDRLRGPQPVRSGRTPNAS